MLTDEEKIEYFENLMSKTVKKLSTLSWDLEKLSLNEPELVAIWRAEVDIYNGGIIQFVCNWGFPTFKLACFAFEKIGAKHALNILKKAEIILDTQLHNIDLNELWDIPKYLTTEDDKKLEILDNQYWENKDNISLLGYQYYCV